ncbi:MAG TPA: sugar kinase [Blastocatellia bacterium]|nr:sugar kinase [Blastocatellia bacterium]
MTHKVAVIGELNVDLIATGLAAAPAFGQEILAADFQITLGSASAIFACGISRLGHAVTFISRVGTDLFGRFCLEALRQAGISTRRVAKDPNAKTGVTLSLSARQDRALVTYLGAIAELEHAQVPMAALKGHRHLHMTSYFLQQKLRPTFAKILARARQMGLTTSFDPNSDPSQTWGEEIREVLAHTDILFVNEPEAKQLTRQQEVQEALKSLGWLVPCAVVKLGPQGAIGTREGEVARAPGFKVNTVDTTGAGDSFAAGFVHGFLEGKSLRECLEIGNACGALSTLQAGGTSSQPDREQVKEFLLSSPSTTGGTDFSLCAVGERIS